MDDTEVNLNFYDRYSCEICCVLYHHPSKIYCCQNGHNFCKKCYKTEYYAQEGTPKCPLKNCNSNIDKFDKSKRNQNFGSVTESKKMFVNPLGITFSASNESFGINELIILNRGDACIQKRPVNCPCPGCHKSITVSSIMSHFTFEHDNITSLTTRYEVRNGLEFNPFHTEYDHKLCILLIHVLEDGESTLSEPISRSNIHRFEQVRPPLFVMSTRIACYHLNNSDEEEEEEDYFSDEECTPYTCITADKVLLWIASSVPTKAKYTISVTTSDRKIRLKYYGHVTHVNENCKKLCERGKGLILSHPHVLGMSCNGTRNLMLDLILHKE